jgi:hypothetical protein
MVWLVCPRCGRKGQYRKETLLVLYGPDETMPDLLHLIAKCERRGELGQTCGIRYGDLLPPGGRRD